MDQKIQRMKELIEILREASRAYYAQDKEIMRIMNMISSMMNCLIGAGDRDGLNRQPYHKCWL